jgi:HSP20 family protein
MAVQQLQPRRSGNAPVSRWDPARDVDDLFRQVSQLMESTLPGGGLPADGAFVPLVDIEETEDAWIFEAEIPGAKREDVNVDVRDSEVVVSGEIKERERKGILRRRTRPVGRFEFRVTLPGDIDADGINASLDDGILTLRIPKTEKARPRRIKIGKAGAGPNGSKESSKS